MGLVRIAPQILRTTMTIGIFSAAGLGTVDLLLSPLPAIAQEATRDASVTDTVETEVGLVPPSTQPTPSLEQPAYLPPGVPPEQTAAARSVSAQDTRGTWGLGLDLGVSGVLPDAGLLVTWRPVRWLHAQAGGGFNIISPGLRAGVTAICPRILPFSLTAEAGHYFQGNANAVVNGLTGQGDDIAILRKVGYDYANVLLGLTSGGKRYVYYFRAGATFLRTTLSNFQETVGQIAATPVEASDLHLSYHGPTVKFGMIAFY